MQPVDTLEPYVEQVYKRLLSAIAHGELRPGQKIPQAEVAASFGVSRQPVSHALHLLRQQGLIELFGKKGLAVSAVQVDHIRDLYQIRGQLDALAARLAAQRVAMGQIAPAELDTVRATLSAAEALTEDAPIQSILDLEVVFHRQIYGLSGNPSIETTLAGHWPHLMRAMALIHGRRKLSHQARLEHEAIFSAIAAGQPEQAERLALAHTNRACIEVASHLESATTP
jgi:DNA-binding GntR family transcriptional regulator